MARSFEHLYYCIVELLNYPVSFAISFIASKSFLITLGYLVLGSLSTGMILYALFLRRQLKQNATQIRKAGKQALQTEEKFRLIIESTSDVIWLSDFNLNLTYISPSVERVLGFTVDEYLSKSVEERTPAKYLKRFKEILNEELEKENNYGAGNKRSRILELEQYHANGHTVWVELSCSFIRNKHGQPIGLHGDMRDISESVNSRRYISKRLEMEQLLSDVSIKSLDVFNFENTINEVLDKAVSILNVSRAFIVQYNSWNNTTINISESCAKGINNRTDYHQQQSCEFSWLCDELMQGKILKYTNTDLIPDDHTKQHLRVNNVLSILLIPMMLNDNFYGYMGFDECTRMAEWQPEDIRVLQSLAFIISSLMERSRTERELIIKERSIELSMEGIAITGLDGRLTYVNQKFISCWKYPNRTDVVNKSIFDFLKSDDYALNILAEIRKSGYWSGELKGIRADGSLFDVYMQASLVTYDDNKPLCIQASFHDITEHKIREQELLKAKEKAEESNRLKSAFLANMNHEIRTPMNAILGFLNLLKEVDISINDKELFIEKINESGRKLLNTFSDIFESAIIEAGETIISENEFDLQELMESLYAQFEHDAQKQNISLRKNIPSGIFMATDKSKLERVLFNLLQNAIKYTIRGYVEFGARLKEGFVEFFVRDTGKGIAEGHADKIFSAFMQEEMNLARRYEGSGLGLSIAKAYVEKLGGKIWFTSNEHGGTTFYFTLPHTPAKPADAHPLDTDNRTKQNLLKGYTILVAEDDQFSYLLLEIMLKGYGADILRVESGEETISMLLKYPEISIILMDIKLKGMNGIEAIRKIREMNINIPIITQTAFAFAEDKRLAIEAGSNEHLTKPINRELLISKIRELLE